MASIEETLQQMFPSIAKDTIQIHIGRYNTPTAGKNYIVERCIDDLLELHSTEENQQRYDTLHLPDFSDSDDEGLIQASQETEKRYACYDSPLSDSSDDSNKDITSNHNTSSWNMHLEPEDELPALFSPMKNTKPQKSKVDNDLPVLRPSVLTNLKTISYINEVDKNTDDLKSSEDLPSVNVDFQARSSNQCTKPFNLFSAGKVKDEIPKPGITPLLQSISKLNSQSLIKPASFSPKRDVNIVKSPSKPVIKPATFSPQKDVNIIGKMSPSKSLIKAARFSPKKDIGPPSKPLIKPATFSPKEKIYSHSKPENGTNTKMLNKLRIKNKSGIWTVSTAEEPSTSGSSGVNHEQVSHVKRLISIPDSNDISRELVSDVVELDRFRNKMDSLSDEDRGNGASSATFLGNHSQNLKPYTITQRDLQHGKSNVVMMENSAKSPRYLQTVSIANHNTQNKTLHDNHQGIEAQCGIQNNSTIMEPKAGPSYIKLTEGKANNLTKTDFNDNMQPSNVNLLLTNQRDDVIDITDQPLITSGEVIDITNSQEDGLSPLHDPNKEFHSQFVNDTGANNEFYPLLLQQNLSKTKTAPKVVDKNEVHKAVADVNEATVQNVKDVQVIQENIVPKVKSLAEQKIDMEKEVITLIPDVDENYVKTLVEKECTNHGFYRQFEYNNDHSMVVNNVCMMLLEQSDYPRKTVTITKPSPDPLEISDKNYYEDYHDEVDFTAQYECETLIQNEFRRISMKTIRLLTCWFRHHYAPVHKVLLEVMSERSKQLKACGKNCYLCMTMKHKVVVDKTEKQLSVQFLKSARPLKSLGDISQKVMMEIQFVQKRNAEEAKEADFAIAQEMNEKEYEETGQLIECGCCYCEVPFENMVQCYEGHLFCRDCLMNYAKESVFGHGKADLLCMTGGCEASFPSSQLSIALPKNIFSKYEDRVKEENINLADLEDLVKCPSCEFAALLDPGDKVFKCQNSSCMKETCRYCQEEWSSHFGKRCEEIEKKDEVKLRTTFEEKMTEAKVRTCHKCKAKFTKLEGCNKMTCRCGATMCYICRKPNIDYNHFCQHVREPKQPCSRCKDCFLWSNAEEDDDRVLKEIKQEEEEAKKLKGYTDRYKSSADIQQPPIKKARIEVVTL